MPELPEVEQTVRILGRTVVGATIDNVIVFREKTITYPNVSEFVQHLVGSQIIGSRRRGKFVILDLNTEQILVAHRRMSGDFLILSADWHINAQQSNQEILLKQGPIFSQNEENRTFYCRVSFHLNDGRHLLFTDPRKFGIIQLWKNDQEALAFRKLGIEPLSNDFTTNKLVLLLANKEKAIKQMLLDQSIIAGIGNLYADEALYLAMIHPKRKASTLSNYEIDELRSAIITVLNAGLETFQKTYKDRAVSTRGFDNYGTKLQVYQQHGTLCARCGTQIQQITLNQRSAHFCPICQPI